MALGLSEVKLQTLAARLRPAIESTGNQLLSQLRMKFTTMMSVSTTFRQHHLRAEHFLKHFLLQPTNPRVSSRQFLIRTAILAKDREVAGVIDFHIKSAIRKRHLQLTQPIDQRPRAIRTTVALHHRLANSTHNSLTQHWLFDALHFLPQDQSQVAVVFAELFQTRF